MNEPNAKLAAGWHELSMDAKGVRTHEHTPFAKPQGVPPAVKVNCMSTIAYVLLSLFLVPTSPQAGLFRCAGSCRTPILSKGEPDKSQTSDMQLLKSSSSHERIEAARRLGEEKNKNAIPVLIEALNDPNQYVRGEAACSLGEIGSMDAVDPLIEALIKYYHRFQTVKEPSDEEGKDLASFYVALEKLTGQKLGSDAAKWKKWQQEERERKAKKQK